MLQTVTIQNFRSLRDITVSLQKVNLLIGPNNSGKSNFLKALAFMKEHYNQRIQTGIVDFERLFFKNEGGKVPYRKHGKKYKSINFKYYWNGQNGDPFNHFYQLELLGFNDRTELIYNEGIGYTTNIFSNKYKLADLKELIENFEAFDIFFKGNATYDNDLSSAQIKSIKGSEAQDSLLIDKADDTIVLKDYINIPIMDMSNTRYGFDNSLPELFNSIKIFKPDPSKITAENELFTYKYMNEDASNLVAFLDNMRDGYDDIWQAIQKDLQRCIPDFIGINFDKVRLKGKESLGKRFGLRDKAGKTYWAEELSEGTIYFLALLAIVHQPDPPKVLLLEEPEKGIHPRRIAEVLDLIFRLAEEKDIQIILTSHSTQVVDAFQEIPESVFVFDMVNGETKIRNLQTDILEADARDAEKKGFPPIDYSKRTLSEHWATGLLGGVPN